MLKHCSPSSVDLRRRSRRNLDNVNESEDGDTSTHSSSSGPEVFAKHVMEDMTEEELDLCEDVVSVRSFSSQNSSGTASKEFQVRTSRTDIIQSSTSTSGSSVLPKSRIVPRNPVSTSIPLKVYAR